MKTPKGQINDNLVALLSDKDFSELMSSQKTIGEQYKLIMDRLDISLEECESSCAAIVGVIESGKKKGILVDEDLELVAGGQSEQALKQSLLLHTIVPEFTPRVFNFSK